MITSGGMPCSRAAATKSSVLMLCTMPRIRRAVPGQPTNARIAVMTTNDCPESIS